MSTSQPSTHESPRHALDNTYMAATRTLLALVRTGAAIAGGGALVVKLLAGGWPRWVVAVLSSAFVLLGYWMMWLALRRGRRMRARLEHEHTGAEFLFPVREVTLITVSLQLVLATVVVLFLIGR